MDSIPSVLTEDNYVPTPEVKRAADRIKELRSKEQQATRECRFEIGDIFNKLRFDSGPRADYLRSRCSEGDWYFYRSCAWVANKWPRSTRTPGKPWDFFKNSDPNGEPKPKTIPSYLVSDMRREEGLSVVTGTNERGRSVKTKFTREQAKSLYEIAMQEEDPALN